MRTRERVHAITIAVEHQSVLEPLRALGREGLELDEVGVDREGMVSPDAIAAALRPETMLVSVQLVNSEMGAVEPVREIAKMLHRKAAPLLHTDAAQAPLWVDLNVEKLGVDLMTLDGQKVLGPKGIGALYIRRGTPIEPILWGGKQERNLRGGTENIPLAGAFAVALRAAQEGVAKRVLAMAAVRDYCFEHIKAHLPDVLLNGPALGALRAANNLNISIPGLESQMAVLSLDALGVAASTRSACNIGEEEPSHVIKALGVPQELAGTAIRLSFLPGFSRADARAVSRALFETVLRYKKR